jgi:sulfotransferase family protein
VTTERATRAPEAEAIMAEAAASAGLDDFGPGDFVDGLRALLDSIDRDADLTPDATERLLDDFRRRLVNRVEVEAWYSEHPETERVSLRGPVDITGLPRTGTTALGAMLSLDPQFRPLRHWEQTRPCPPPELEREADDPRRVAMTQQNAQLPSELEAMHHFEVDAAAEDTELLGMAFHGQQYTLPVYGYHEWWRNSDMTATYAYHRRVMQLLGSRRAPDRWLFKAPHHTFHLEALVAAYPDATFLWTHRDPVKAVPSYASLVSTLFPPQQHERDLVRLGREVSGHLRIGTERAMAARARLGEDRFVDVQHRDLVDDPERAVRQVYDALGLELHPAVEAAMQQWQASNRPGSRGTHRYTASQFGLGASELRSDFAFYTDHFDVALEG